MSHIAVLCHQKLPDGKEDGNSDDTDQCLCRFHMLYHHLSRRRKHQDLNHRLCRMLTEHLDKLDSDYQRQCICKKLFKKFSLPLNNFYIFYLLYNNYKLNLY